MAGKPPTVEQTALLARIATAFVRLGVLKPEDVKGAGGLGAFTAAVHGFTEQQGPAFSQAVRAAPTPEARAALIADAAEARAARGTAGTEALRLLGLAATGFLVYRAAKKNGPGAAAGALLNHLAGMSR